MHTQYNIIQGILVIIIIITSYLVLNAGYNAFITYSRRAEAFAAGGQQGTCDAHEFAQFTDKCAYDMRGGAAARPLTPQMKRMNTVLQRQQLSSLIPASFLQRLQPSLASAVSSGPTATQANEAAIGLLQYINQRRALPSMFRLRNAIKCLFFTCSSPVHPVADMTAFLAGKPTLFSRASAGPASRDSPADQLMLILSYLDTRKSADEDAAFFTALHTYFMGGDKNAVLRPDIPFGQLAAAINPEHIFANN
jgi:hypothetical protein